MSLPTSVQGASIIVGMLRLGALAVSNVASSGATSSAGRASILAFQRAWNLAIPTMRTGGMTAAQTPQLAEDGLYGRNTASALTMSITNGSAPLPATSSGLATWWATNQAGVSQYVSGIVAQAQQAVVAGTHDAQAAAAVASGSDQIVATTTAAANQIVQTATANSGVQNIQPQGGDTTFVITPNAPKTNTWLVVTIGLGLVATATIIGWAAWRKKKRGKKP
jgi:hypothetical protein